MKGTFRAKAIEGAMGRAGTGTEQVAVLVELETGERLTWYGYFSDAAAERTCESLIHMGVTDLESLAGLGSTEFEVVVDEEEFDGKLRDKIKFINRLGSGGVALRVRMSDAEKRSFAQRFKGKFLSMQRQLGGGPAQPPTAVTDDDPPF